LSRPRDSRSVKSHTIPGRPLSSQPAANARRARRRVRQNVANFSEPTKQLDALTRSRRIVHDGNPVLAWMIDNVVSHYNAKENVYPRKERPENKVDGNVALIMAIGRHMVVEGQPDLDEFLKNAVMV
jgi:phage terminase large subunit-like protein